VTESFSPPELSIVASPAPELAGQAAAIFYEAFREKIHRLELFPRSPEQAIRIIERSLDLSSGRCALVDGRVAGVAGWQYGDQRCYRLHWPTLVQEFGWLGAAARMFINRLQDAQAPRPGELRVEALAVAPDLRGRGVGTALLAATEAHARALHLRALLIEAVDTNTGARRLYERFGFVTTRILHFGPFTRRAGFTGAVCMRKELESTAAGIEDDQASQQTGGQRREVHDDRRR
jgi:ribosomal protein S18 acetylase RimI-like enzyme